MVHQYGGSHMTVTHIVKSAAMQWVYITTNPATKHNNIYVPTFFEMLDRFIQA